MKSKQNLEQIKHQVMNHHSEGGVDHVGPQKRKGMVSASTRAKHAKPVEAFVAVQPTAPKKRRKEHLPGKSRGEATMKKKATDRTLVRKTDSAALFEGETKPYKADRCQAVIIIETFHRGTAVVKGIIFEKEKSHGPGDFNHVAGEKQNKK